MIFAERTDIDRTAVCERAAATAPTDADEWAAIGASYLVNGNKAEARDALAKAIELDSAVAHWVQSLRHLFGPDRESDWHRQEALRWARLAAHKGSADAQHYLAWHLLYGSLEDPHVSEEDFAEAVRWYSKASWRSFPIERNFDIEVYTNPMFVYPGDDGVASRDLSEVDVIANILQLLVTDLEPGSVASAETIELRRREVRRKGTRALRRIGGPHAVEILVRLLDDADLAVRLAADQALRELGHGHAVEPGASEQTSK